jgi:L-asparaginase II
LPTGATIRKHHHGSLAVVNAQGELLASVGDVDSQHSLIIKPLQAMPCAGGWALRTRKRR